MDKEINPTWQKKLTVIGLIIATSGGLFALVANITQQPYIALISTVIVVIGLSAYFVFQMIYILQIGIGWLLTIAIGLAIFILIPSTGMITVVVLDRENNPLERENVYLLDLCSLKIE